MSDRIVGQINSANLAVKDKCAWPCDFDTSGTVRVARWPRAPAANVEVKEGADTIVVDQIFRGYYKLLGDEGYEKTEVYQVHGSPSKAAM